MNRKSRMLAALFQGLFLASFYVYDNLSNSKNNTKQDILISVGVGLASGALAGFFFWWFMGPPFSKAMHWLAGKFSKSDLIIKQLQITTQPDEIILFETFANHFKGIEGVGGKLYLTNKRLIFKSHKLNIQNHQLNINLKDISGIEDFKIHSDTNNALSVTLTNEKKEKFVVEQPEEWLARLR